MKTILTLAILASAAMAVGSCSERISQETPSAPGSFSISAVIDGTKTITGTDFKLSWAEGDHILVAVRDSIDRDSPGWGEKAPIDFLYDSGTALFKSGSDIAAGTCIYALYSGNPSQDSRFRMSSKASPKYELQTEQAQSLTDALGSLNINDPLAGSVETAGEGETTTLQMHHLFSLMKVTLVNNTGASIMVGSLTMTAEENLSGVFDIDYSSPVPCTGTCSDGHKSVRVSLTEDVTLAEGGSCDFLFLIAPLEGYNGKITLQAASSSGRTWTRSVTASGLDFKAGTLNKTNFTVTEADPGVYKLYSGDLTEGDYIVTSESNKTGDDGIYAMVCGVEEGRLKYKKVTVTDEAVTTDDSEIVWHIARNGEYWTLYSASSNVYAASTGVKNKAQLLSSGTDDKASWTVSGTGSYIFTNKYNKGENVNPTLKYNPTYGFACYGESFSLPLTLYKLNGSQSITGKQPAATLGAASASGITKNTATLSSSYSGCSSVPTEVGFQWGTSSQTLDNTASAAINVDFSAYLSDLQAETTYWYRPYVTVHGTGEYASESRTFYGETSSFTTLGESSPEPAKGGWLSLYEVPACNVSTSEEAGYTTAVSEKYGGTKAYVCTVSSTQKVVTHTFSYDSKVCRNYTMLFDKDKRCALWTCFAMHGVAFKDNNVGRNEGWSYDPALPNDWQPNMASAYTGYTRGHQVASEDRQTTADQNRQTFYYSNMSPQLSGLNSSGWNTLENNVQKLGYGLSGKDTLYVVTGPIFESGYTTCKDKSGNACAVPTKYFKCIMKCSFDASGNATSALAAGYWFNHASGATRNDVTVDAIEQMTGFDLFTNVPKAIQDAAEKNLYKFF